MAQAGFELLTLLSAPPSLLLAPFHPSTPRLNTGVSGAPLQCLVLFLGPVGIPGRLPPFLLLPFCALLLGPAC